MYSKITIHNFRGSSSLELLDTTKVNVLTGHNGSGKTTILEALFILSGGGNASLTSSLHAFRGENFTSPDSDSLFRGMFHNFEADKNGIDNPSISALSTWDSSGDADEETVELNILPLFDTVPITTSATRRNNLTGVSFSFVRPTGTTVTKLFWQPAITLPTLVAHSNARLAAEGASAKTSLNAFFISPYIQQNSLELSSQATALTKEKRIDQLVDVMKEIEPRLRNLHPLQEGGVQQIFADIGLAHLVPISLLGSGFSNFMKIVMPVLLLRDGCILIDEFEDGIHRSLLGTLLRRIIDLIRDRNIQLFITTHSDEFLTSFVKTSKECDFHNAALYRLSQKAASPVTRFTEDDLVKLIDNNMDMR